MARVAMLLVLLFVGALGFGIASSGPTDAQDRTEDRLNNLETQVAQLTARVDALEGGDRGETAEDAGRSDESGGVRWSGSGVAVSEGFQLSPGRYRASASVQTTDVGGFACVMFGPDDYWELVFNELIDGAGTWTGESVVEVETAGEYFLEISNTTADWSIVISRL